MNIPFRHRLAMILVLSLCWVGCGGRGYSSNTTGNTNQQGGSNPPSPAPGKIEVSNGAVSAPGDVIPDGSTDGHHAPATDFGQVGNTIGDWIGKDFTKVFRIANVGTQSTQITGVTLSGSGATQFVISQHPETVPLPVGGTALFQVSWRPNGDLVLGDNKAIVHVLYAGNTYSFEIVGTIVDSGHH